MEVTKKKVTELLRSNLLMVIGTIVSLPFWWVISKMISWLAIKTVFAYDYAYRYDEHVGSILFLLILCTYIRYLVLLYKRSMLKLDHDRVVLKGSSGWRLVDSNIPVSDLKVVKLKRCLEFQRGSGQTVRLASVYGLYDSNSLNSFFRTLSDRGIKIQDA
ncbi:hypothetical protein [Photobacterium alginatilyticum]|uniref:PH domain-containing protein n=1 Tax=Photobacterium alginatilyticum TaxID=1775171 RepID=A0ABW9YS64_9GAMM|nr:hypothetical protein [Photobacterium alginatilyticum]NBI56372.1 hypothetical protein [Photobacterium alginatilyticum]